MLKGTLCLYGMSQVCHSMLSRPPPFRFITRVAPHCDNTLMIQHVAHKTRFHRAKLSPGIGEHILAEIDAESLHLGEEAVHLRRRGVVVGVVVGAEEAALARPPPCFSPPLRRDAYNGSKKPYSNVVRND